MAATISTLEGEFRSIDTIARYGAGGTHLAKLLEPSTTYLVRRVARLCRT